MDVPSWEYYEASPASIGEGINVNAVNRIEKSQKFPYDLMSSVYIENDDLSYDNYIDWDQSLWNTKLFYQKEQVADYYWNL